MMMINYHLTLPPPLLCLCPEQWQDHTDVLEGTVKREKL